MAEPKKPLKDRSILNDVKKGVGLEPDYDVFDMDIILSINAAFVTIHQVEARSDKIFQIEDDTETWSMIEHQETVGLLKQYIISKVRLTFDIPPTSYLITALEKQVREMEWRLNVASDRRIHVNGTK